VNCGAFALNELLGCIDLESPLLEKRAQNTINGKTSTPPQSETTSFVSIPVYRLAVSITPVLTYARNTAASAGAGAIATLSSIAAGALVSGGGNIIQQSVDKGVRNVNFGESSEAVLFSLLSGGVSQGIPNIPIDGNDLPSALNSYEGNGVLHEGVSTLIETGLGIGQSYLSSRTASVAAPNGAGTTAITSTKPSGATGGGVTTSNSGGGVSSITIPKGATLSGLAQQYGTTVSSLASINHISNPNVIYAGATLKVP
jgi:hypothetical protein